MKAILKLLLGLVVAAALLWQFRYLFEPPCSRPLTYDIGTFDTRFNVSREYFLGALAEAEAIWEKPFGRELFAYASTTGRMKVNLIYDYRQETSSKLQDLGSTVENNRATYDSMVAKYDALKRQYAQAKADYDLAAASFKERHARYQEDVAYWNKSGGAPKKEYADLQARQSSLQAELDSIKAMETRVNQIAGEINMLVGRMNSLAASLNLTVKKYNTIGTTLGEFEEGLYQTQGGRKSIDIYEFKGRDNLVRVLAHEFGHALDLDHVSDPDAIMYSYNQSLNMRPTEADLAELKSKCI